MGVRFRITDNDEKTTFRRMSKYAQWIERFRLFCVDSSSVDLSSVIGGSCGELSSLVAELVASAYAQFAFKQITLFQGLCNEITTGNPRFNIHSKSTPFID